MYENLRAARIEFRVETVTPGMVSAEDPTGREWIVAGNDRIRYRDAAGFLIRKAQSDDGYVARPDAETFRRSQQAITEAWRSRRIL